MSETIYDGKFEKYLPQALASDPKMAAFAKVMADGLAEVSRLMENVLIYSRIDEIPESLVDILAHDMHVDWYDYDYPLEVKRELLKGSIKVHKKMGTKYAIEKALSALYPESKIEEWFEYGGEPGYFRIICDVTDSKVIARYKDIVREVEKYKRLSAHMDKITFRTNIKNELCSVCRVVPRISGKIQEKAVVKAEIRINIKNELKSGLIAHIKNDVWHFDGAYRFDGTKQWDAYERTEEL